MALALSLANANNSHCEPATETNRRVAKRSTGKMFCTELEQNSDASSQFNRIFDHLDAVRIIWRAGHPMPENGQGVHYPWLYECNQVEENIFSRTYRNAVQNTVKYTGLGNITGLCTTEIEHHESWNGVEAKSKYHDSIGKLSMFSTVLLYLMISLERLELLSCGTTE